MRFGTVAYLFITLLQFATMAAAQGTATLADLAKQLAPDEPQEVHVGVTVTQITDVNQKAESFGVVARIILRWQDDRLAYDPGEAGSQIRSMSGPDFVQKARQLGIFVPVATIENQQSRSFDKESRVVWFADGRATAAREVIVTLQAPDFDFRHYPFDRQSFYVRLLATAPTSFVRFTPLDELSGMGTTLGEEEWVVSSVWTEVDEVMGISGLQSARFSLGFSAHRHMLYYWARIFVPLLLLLGVAWANLFLEEYRRRIDIASGNLLAFIAYNFAISGELPRLGYLTFLDCLMMAMFIVSAGAVAYNVTLRRMSMAGRENSARALDWHVTHWGFPAIIGGSVFGVWAYFFT